MDTLTKLFRTSIWWNSAGAFGYQFLLLTHQIALYRHLSPATYGVISILLSLIFFGAVLADAGFDATLSTFFNELTKSRTLFKKTLIPHWISIAFVASMISCFFIFSLNNFFTTVTLSTLVVGSTIITLIAESFRRSLRMTLQLSFRAKTATLLDIGTITAFLLIVWGSFFAKRPLSLELLMGALALTSTLCSLMMGLFVYQWQKKLSDTGCTSTVSTKKLFLSRLINGGNLLTHQLFSGNVLVPLIGMSCGLAEAGLIKLASHLAHGLITSIRKIIGFSGAALLSALKTNIWDDKRAAFWHLSQKLYTILFFSLIALTSMSSRLVTQEIVTYQQSSILLLVVLLIISEGLYLVYETLFIIEEKVWYTVALNSLLCLVAISLILCRPTLPLITLLKIILGLRISLFFTIALFAAHLWPLHTTTPSVTRSALTRTTLLAGLAYLCGSPLALLLSR